MALLARKALLAIAAVVDIATGRGRPLSAKALAARYDVPTRYFEPLLQALARRGIVKGVRGARGGYKLGRERNRISADQIAEAAGLDGDEDRCAGFHVLENAITPAIEEAERAFSAALARITVDDLVRRAHPPSPSAGRQPLHAMSNSDRATGTRVALLPQISRDPQDARRE
jgi:Rrf2 family transcriptional regulator, iron-sulfur cluster assembly transcription factor